MKSASYSPPPVSFGPGPLTRAVRAIIIANVAVFVLALFAGQTIRWTFGLVPADVLTLEVALTLLIAAPVQVLLLYK